MNRKMKRFVWVVAPMLALAVLSAAADDRPAAKKTSNPRPTSIVGSAWNADNTPIKGAHVRLRNVVTGKVEAVARANDAGEFTFENVEGGSYVVELVTDTGHVQTVSHVFTIAPGETIATFVRLGPKIPWAGLLFNNTAGNVAATAATEGIAVIVPSGLCQSPPCH